jgi:hypothetical protein
MAVSSGQERDGDHNVEVIREQDRARGGVSFVAILTGVVVALGAFVMLFAIVGGVLAAVGVAEGGISPKEVSTAGVAAGIGLVVAQFIAYSEVATPRAGWRVGQEC